MSILGTLFAGAVLAGTAYLQAKENMSCSDSEYKEMKTSEKVSSLVEGTETWLYKMSESQKERFVSVMRNKPDISILRALRQCDKSDWRYELLYEEAQRRDIDSLVE